MASPNGFVRPTVCSQQFQFELLQNLKQWPVAVGGCRKKRPAFAVALAFRILFSILSSASSSSPSSEPTALGYETAQWRRHFYACAVKRASSCLTPVSLRARHHSLAAGPGTAQIAARLSSLPLVVAALAWPLLATGSSQRL